MYIASLESCANLNSQITLNCVQVVSHLSTFKMCVWPLAIAHNVRDLHVTVISEILTKIIGTLCQGVHRDSGEYSIMRSQDDILCLSLYLGYMCVICGGGTRFKFVFPFLNCGSC